MQNKSNLTKNRQIFVILIEKEVKMLTIGLFVNGRIIDRIDIVNKIKKNKKGQTKYLVDNKWVIWHKRSDGARILAKKVFDYLIKNQINVNDYEKEYYRKIIQEKLKNV